MDRITAESINGVGNEVCHTALADGFPQCGQLGALPEFCSSIDLAIDMGFIEQISLLSSIVTTPRFLRIKRGTVFFLPRGADPAVKSCQWALMVRLGLLGGIDLERLVVRGLAC
jgi:hypothetical protein